MIPEQETMGDLHKLLIRGLPDYVENGNLKVKTRLAPRIGISYQAVYKWLSKDRIAPKRVEAIVHLSEKTQNRPETMVIDDVAVPWAPLKKEDFWAFM